MKKREAFHWDYGSAFSLQNFTHKCYKLIKTQFLSRAASSSSTSCTAHLLALLDLK